MHSPANPNRPQAPAAAASPASTAATLVDFVQPLGWLTLLIVPLSVYYAVDWEALQVTKSVGYCILILLCAVIMWVFRLLPDFVPSVFLLVGLLSLGVAPPEAVFSGYSSQVFFLALSVLSLSSVIMSSGLSNRIMLFTMHKWRPKNKYLFSSIVFLFGLLATPFIPSTNGRAALIAPFLQDALKQIPPGSKEHQRLVVALLAGISLLSPVFLSAKSINLLLWGMLSSQDQYSFNYLFWMIAALLPGVILLVLFLIAQALLFFNREQITIDAEMIERQYRALPPVGRQEMVGCAALASFILLVTTYSYHHIEIHLVAFILFFALLFFNIINQKQISNSIDWGFLIFLGAMVGFTNVLQGLELNDLVVAQFQWLMRYVDDNIHLFIFLLSALVFVIRLFITINATVILLAGALIPAVAVLGSYAWLVGFIILMMSESFIWPYQASYYMQCNAVLGKRHFQALHAPRVYAINALVFALKLASIYLSLPYWRLLGVL
ncbi:MAG: SLC13 family permease [Gammaproteobacteria bacterium]|nr:SLC13 family permease [Gammaproteobacteria bacterium]